MLPLLLVTGFTSETAWCNDVRLEIGTHFERSIDLLG